MTDTDGLSSTSTNSTTTTDPKRVIGLYVDDLRPLPREYDPEEWDIARSFHQAIVMLEQYPYQVVSLDHDLASFYGQKEMTGYDIAMWMVYKKNEGVYVPRQVFVHSANPIGSQNIQAVIDRYLTD